MKVLVAHPGTQYSHQLVVQLEKHNLLYRFYTGIAIAKPSFIYSILKRLPFNIYIKIQNRVLEVVPKKKLKILYCLN